MSNSTFSTERNVARDRTAISRPMVNAYNALRAGKPEADPMLPSDGKRYTRFMQAAQRWARAYGDHEIRFKKA